MFRNRNKFLEKRETQTSKKMYLDSDSDFSLKMTRESFQEIIPLSIKNKYRFFRFSKLSKSQTFKRHKEKKEQITEERNLSIRF